MSETERPPGKTTIAPEVLLTIVRLAAMSTPGVSKLAQVPTGVERLFKTEAEGATVVVENNTVYADLYVILQRDVNVRDVSHAIQNQVSRSIAELVGMDVGKICIHVEDIDYAQPQ